MRGFGPEEPCAGQGPEPVVCPCREAPPCSPGRHPGLRPRDTGNTWTDSSARVHEAVHTGAHGGGSTAFLSNVYGPGTRAGTGLVQGQHGDCLQALTQGASGFTCKLRQGKLVSFLQGTDLCPLPCLENRQRRALTMRFGSVSFRPCRHEKS